MFINEYPDNEYPDNKYYDDSYNQGLNFNLILPIEGHVINSFILIYFPLENLSPKINFQRPFLTEILFTTKIKQLLFFKNIHVETDFEKYMVNLRRVSKIEDFIEVFNVVTNNKPIYYYVAPSKKPISKETFLKTISDKC